MEDFFLLPLLEVGSLEHNPSYFSLKEKEGRESSCVVSCVLSFLFVFLIIKNLSFRKMSHGEKEKEREGEEKENE